MHRLELPFQEVHHQNLEPIGQLPALADAQALDLLGQMRPIDQIELTGADQCRLPLSPEEEVLLVGRAALDLVGRSRRRRGFRQARLS